MEYMKRSFRAPLVVHAWNPSTEDAEAGRLLLLKTDQPGDAISSSQPAPQSQGTSKNKNKKHRITLHPH